MAQKIRQIEMSIKRTCEECDDVISAARLLAHPQAKKCIHCQQDAENSGRFRRHTMDQKVRSKGDEVESIEPIFIRGTG